MTDSDFNRLLDWLDPDRDVAARRYEEIRQSLIKIFFWRGLVDAEDLADEVINRVTSKVGELSKTFVGEPARYFYGVARKILLECERRDPSQMLPDSLEAPDEVVRNAENIQKERLQTCLDECLEKLIPEDRDLILSYYRENKQAKIDFRKELADELGMATNALRVKVYRLRLSLKACIEDCMKQFSANEMN